VLNYTGAAQTRMVEPNDVISHCEFHPIPKGINRRGTYEHRIFITEAQGLFAITLEPWVYLEFPSRKLFLGKKSEDLTLLLP
jgi:hypothetical protein